MSPQEILHAINTQVAEIKTLREKNGALETMVANLQKTISKLNQTPTQLTQSQSLSQPPPITSLSPTVSNSASDYVDTLLKKIEALEKRLEERVPPIPSIPVDKGIPLDKIIHKSKSMPEVMVSLNSLFE
jgi:FtsZ-binding cell division protein ZapB